MLLLLWKLLLVSFVVNVVENDSFLTLSVFVYFMLTLLIAALHGELKRILQSVFVVSLTLDCITNTNKKIVQSVKVDSHTHLHKDI